MHVEFTIRTPIDLPLAAEVEIPVQWIAYWPAAVVGQKCVDRLSFAARYLLDRRAGPGGLLIAAIKHHTRNLP